MEWKVTQESLPQLAVDAIVVLHTEGGKAVREDDRGAYPGVIQCDQAFEHARRRDRHDCCVHVVRQIADGAQCGQAVDHVGRGMDRYNRAGKFPFEQVVDDNVALRRALRGRADNRDPSRPNQRSDVPDQFGTLFYTGRNVAGARAPAEKVEK